MHANHNTSGSLNRVAKVKVVDLEVLCKPAFLHQGKLKCIDERGRRSIVAVDTKGVEATALLAVGDYPNVDNIPSDAKFTKYQT